MTLDDAILEMRAGRVAEPCGLQDDKGLPCGLRAGHPSDGAHYRLAVDGEPPYLPGPGNSVVRWVPGPKVVRVPR